MQLRDPLDAAHVRSPRCSTRGASPTGAAIANSVIYRPESNFDQGFDFFAGLHGEDDRPSKLVDADVVVDAALAFLRSRRGMPTFLYVHTMDPHVPYAPPAALRPDVRAAPDRGHPGATRAPTTRSRSTASA